MAITACYAGPVFNMLVGTGVGFAMLLKVVECRLRRVWFAVFLRRCWGWGW